MTDERGEPFQPVTESRYPNISQALWLLTALMGVALVVAVPVGILCFFLNIDFNRQPVALGMVNFCAFWLVMWWGLRKTGMPFRAVFPLAPIRVALLPPMALAVFGMSILLSEVDNVVRLLLPMPGWMIELFTNLAGVGTSIPGAFLTLVVVAPLTEEPLFRGLLLRGFLKHYSPRKAILASALLFGAFHLNPWQFPTATVLGALFGWWAVRTRSLLPGLFGHALNNALPVIYLSLVPVKVPGYAGDLAAQTGFQPFWLDLIGVALTALGIGLLWRLLPKPVEA